MNTTTAPNFALPAAAPASARVVLQLLRRLSVGTLDVQLPNGSQLRFGGAEGPRAALRLLDWRACSAALKSGDIGFAEAWIDGHWTTPDLVALLELLIANREAIERVVYGSWWGSLVHRLRHLFNRNTREGSRKNIHAHYDLGNAFYRLWLDPSMNYSSAWFDGDLTQDLTRAQDAKVARALERLQLQPGQRVLEVGCGWGAVAEAAARRGLHLTGITLSTEQLGWARARLDRLGLQGQADLRLQDYRDVADAPFDGIVSIEMFEAVGREYWDGYFALLRDKLASGGRACVQSITIRDDLFQRYLRSTDFIQQYIFPGGLLPSVSEFHRRAEAAGLQVEETFAFGPDYAETLRRWRAAFLAREAEVRELGFDTRFMRIWDFYLAYCQAAFATGNTDVVQFTLRKP